MVGRVESFVALGTDRPSFSDELRKRRVARGWGQVAFAMELRRAARRMGISEPSIDGNTVSRWERGKQSPDPFYQVLICEAFGALPLELGLGQALARPSERIEPVKRREFLSYGGGLAAAALDLESLGAVLDRMHPPDDRRLDDLGLLIRGLEEKYDTTPPRDLMRVARGHLVSMRLVIPPRAASLARRLGSLTAELAVLSGRLSYRLQNQGDAEMYYALADEMVKEGGDVLLRALTLAARSSLYSNIGKGSRSTLVITLLDEADRIAGGQSSSGMKAWLCAHRAEWQTAVGVLEQAAAMASSAMISQRSAVLIDLATAYARQGEYERACELLSSTLDLATAAHLPEIVRRAAGG